MNPQSFKEVIAKLPAKDVGFASSLLEQWERRGTLSGAQFQWVAKLTARAATPETPREVSVGNFSGVMRLFETAKQHLRYPKIRLQLGPQALELSLSGPRSKAPGTVQVTDGGPYPHNVWFGRVDTDGQWTTSRNSTPQIESFLKEFSERPAEVARRYGRLTGNCCFCARKLSDPRSTAAGFGATCAEHFGLTAEWKAASAVLGAEA